MQGWGIKEQVFVVEVFLKMETTKACLKADWNDPVRRGKMSDRLQKEDTNARAMSL